MDRRLEFGDGAAVPALFNNCTAPTVTIVRLWCSLRQSQEFKDLFSARVTLHTQPGGALSTMASLARFDTLNAFIESAIIGESARWGDSLKTLGGEFNVTRTRSGDWQSTVTTQRNLVLDNTDRLLHVLRKAG
jgi:hypothetical protein